LRIADWHLYDTFGRQAAVTWAVLAIGVSGAQVFADVLEVIFPWHRDRATGNCIACVLEYEFSRRHCLDAYTNGLENPLMDRPPVVTCNQLCKNYGSTPVVRDLDLAILPGTCYGLLGPNGAGKTTTLW